MEQSNIISAAEDYIRKIHLDDSSGHDYWHIKRVESLAVKLAHAENADVFLCRLSALLHDVDDYKTGGDEENLPVAKKLLNEQKISKDIHQRVLSIIRQVSFKGARVVNQPLSIEAMCVQDADRLDAIGAIGIARTFAFGGKSQRSIYDPGIKPVCNSSYSEYKNNNSPTVNHFYEKLLLLKDRMNTDKARQIAVKRHQFMEEFLRQFYLEWETLDAKL